MIPDYQSCMLPLLEFAADKKEHRFSEAVDALSFRFHLTEEECRQLLPSKSQNVMANRVGWACSYMKKAGLLQSSNRGCFRITDRGTAVLTSKPKQLKTKDLMQFEEFKLFIKRSSGKSSGKTLLPAEVEEITPKEMIETGYAKLSENLADELLQKIGECTPAFFERLVVDLLVRMGYGGSFKEAAQIVGKSSDEGIDGVIKEDKLGLDTIYIQAKRWKGAVGRPEIQKFAGALLGQQAAKGVFMTTGLFTKEAEEYAARVDRKVVLIDGQTLAALMIEYKVGVSIAQTYEINKIDLDYFEE
ncbi:MAG TPA: restriction endonuclease [Candidatus Treponema faecavium]|nr:restriction endonuclease [Candidatus Treponema faecavium]